MKIVLIGGHLSPALSVLESLPKDAKVLFIGRKYALEGDNALSLEYKTITSMKVPFVALSTGRLQRKLTRHTIPSLLKLPLGIIESFSELIKFKPDVVVGFGGYVSVPVVFCAFILKIPVVIHEQTLDAGFANRLLFRFATKICISWETSRKYFPKDKTVLTGNPIRKFMVHGSWLMAKNKDKLPVIYVTGGSSGSHFINVLIEGAIRDLLEKYCIIHQTGDSQEFNDFGRLEKLRSTFPPNMQQSYILKKFIDPSEVGIIFNKSSLIVTRSGINTIAELLYFEKPALLIPLPFSQNNEQLKNAKFLERLGLGKVLQQSELDSKKLLQAITSTFDSINNFKINKKELKNLPGKNAAENIIQVINYVCKNKKKIV